MDNNNESNKEKENSYYQQIVQGWINTRMEKDKSLLTLSAGGIGLLITLLTTTKNLDIGIKYLYFSAIFLFIIVLISTITIFSLNSKYLENIINEKNDNNGTFLKFLDILSITCFIIAILISFIIAIVSTF
ncbi:hypothetical protein [Caldithrix abyssi]|uniref:hypothetical protein n=1 Tax=Caldithrix abyssi TaxID=187145 RepID=UPI0005C4E9FB|nr:hypothetical protein [Caldithrix abyssi]